MSAVTLTSIPASAQKVGESGVNFFFHIEVRALYYIIVMGTAFSRTARFAWFKPIRVGYTGWLVSGIFAKIIIPARQKKHPDR